MAARGVSALLRWEPCAPGRGHPGAYPTQNAFQVGALSVSLPVIDTIEPVSAVIIGGRVVLTPDEAAAEAIATVYRRFDELGSARQVLLSLLEDGLLLPRRRTGSRRITWAPASYPAVHDFLTNPAYAGAFVFGRTRAWKRVDASGKVISGVRVLPASSGPC